MKILKKAVSFFTILFLLQTNISYAGDYIPTQLYLAGKKIERIKNGKKYKKALDNFIKQTPSEKLEKILPKIEKLEKKLENNNSQKAQQLKIILNYLKISAKYKIEKNPNITIIQNNNISLNDKELVKKEILKIQKSIGNNIIDFIKNFSSDFDKLTKFEEKGNTKINLNIDYDEIGKVNSEFYTKNYTYKSNLIDTELNAELGLKINSKLKNDIEKNLDINGKVNYIEKDGIGYLLIEKLNILDKKGFEEFDYYIKKLEDIAKKNKYIKFENFENKAIADIIKNINLNKINNDINELTNTPLLEAYKKEENKYYLKPTKYACDKFKELSNKFDPINGKICSTSQYTKLVKEFEKEGELYLTIDKNNKKLIYKIKPDNTIENGEIIISFDEKNIKSINVNIIPNQQRFKNEGFKLNYTYKKELNLSFYAKKGKLNTKLNIKLDNYNKIKELKLSSKNDFPGNNLNIGLIIENNTINGNLSLINKKYSWKEKSYIPYEIFNLNIKGDINKLNINSYFKNLEENKTLFEGNIKKVNSYISGNSYLNDKNNNNIFTSTIKGTITKKGFNINNKIIFNKNYISKIANQEINSNIESNIKINVYNYNNTYKLSFIIDSILNKKKIFNFSIQGEAKRNYSQNIEINKPTNFIELKDLK